VTPVGSPTPGSPTVEEPVGLKTSDAWKDTEQVKKVKRTDSQKRDQRTRTLSLKTRRHTPSFKDKYRSTGDLPPADIEGTLERKQELMSGGKKATIRSWKYYYTVLCGQLLCFFKDEQGMEMLL
jgi:spectrin beta